MSSRWPCGCVLVLVVLASAGARPADAPADAPATRPSVSSGQTYPIKLVRPVQVGDRYNYVSDAMMLRTMTAVISGRMRTLRPSTVSVHLEAVEHVLEVNPNGEPSKATYTVSKCTLREDKREKTFLEPGTVLTVTAGRWKSRIELDEGKVSIADEILLRGVVSVPNLKGVTMDDCFGSVAPRAAGEAWAINADKLAQLLSRQAVRIKTKDISGSVKLKNVQAVDGVPHLLVQGRAQIEHWTPEATLLPPGTKFVSGSDEIKFTRLLPADPSGHCVTDSFSEKTLMKVTTDDATIGPEVLVDVKVLQTVGIKRTPVHVGDVASGNE